MAEETAVTEYERLSADLRSAIVTGELQPGDRLVEAALAERYRVSRGTVREALRLLASQDLVETTRGRTGGTFVARVRPEAISDYLRTSVGVLLTHEDLALSDLVEVRQVIEPFAAGLAAARHEPGPVAALRDLQASATSTRRDELNWEWHREVLRLSGNPLLPALALPVYELLNTRFDRRTGRRGHWRRIEREHALITELIEAGDARGAEAAMRDHLNAVHLTYLDLATSTTP
jgi:GntR family transcriptional regulator, transcriptional repressor for pyruvate dehydrogenase complex